MEKLIIKTDVFNKDKAPYILGTIIDFSSSETIITREAKYKDTIGFYFTSTYFELTDQEKKILNKWVQILNKSLVCIIECDGIVNSWLFSKQDNGTIQIIETKASTTNQVNYYIWTEPTPSFWENADFLTKGEEAFEEEYDPFTQIMDRIENVEAGVLSAVNAIEALTKAIQVIGEEELTETTNEKGSK